MIDNAFKKCDGNGSMPSCESVCIDCSRVLDSCKDKDCFDDVRVFLTDFGQEVIEKTGSIRSKCAHIIWTSITVDPVQFNRGFYQIYIRFYVKLIFEACICPGKVHEIEGIAVCEKKVILYGSEGNVHIFRSNPDNNSFCAAADREQHSTNLPVAVCEVVDPIVLSAKICDKCTSNCCCLDELPDGVCCCVNGTLCDSGRSECSKQLNVALGFFSVVRIERPAQYLINAAEYNVPDKECVVSEDNDPCSLFKRMSFPVTEFSPPSYRQISGGSGCGNTCSSCMDSGTRR